MKYLPKLVHNFANCQIVTQEKANKKLPQTESQQFLPKSNALIVALKVSMQ